MLKCPAKETKGALFKKSTFIISLITIVYHNNNVGAMHKSSAINIGYCLQYHTEHLHGAFFTDSATVASIMAMRTKYRGLYSHYVYIL